MNSNEENLIRIYPNSDNNKSNDINKNSLRNNKQSNKDCQIKEKPNIFYDVIILGTSLKENILAALLSEKKL